MPKDVRRPAKAPNLTIVARDGSMRSPARKSRKRRPREPAFPATIQFARGSATPRAGSLQLLWECGVWLEGHREEAVVVVGHANTRGWDRPARALARARAAAVTDLLVLLGAQRSQVDQAAAPRLHSVVPDSARGERRQRRVVVLYRAEPPVGIAASLRRAVKAVRRRAG
jgi:outer membrane protein OmpA-like peptidoglycan-associated protein